MKGAENETFYFVFLKVENERQINIAAHISHMVPDDFHQFRSIRYSDATKTRFKILKVLGSFSNFQN
jgi:hypothetical protein